VLNSNEIAKIFHSFRHRSHSSQNRLVEHYEAEQEGCLAVDSSRCSVRVGFAVQHYEPIIILAVSIFSDQLRK